jgi:hypothetical protein
MTLTNLIFLAVGAVVVAVIRIGKLLEAWDRIMSRVQAPKAKVSADFRYRNPTKNGRTEMSLTLVNSGDTRAERVTLEVDGVAIDEHERFRRIRPQNREQPVILEPDAPLTWKYMTSLNSPTEEHTVEITWSDPRGGGHWESTLSTVTPC